MSDKELTIEEKREWLKEHGWYQLWNEDNWLKSGVNYSNPDWAGMSTESAYDIAMDELDYKQSKGPLRLINPNEDE